MELAMVPIHMYYPHHCIVCLVTVTSRCWICKLASWLSWTWIVDVLAESWGDLGVPVVIVALVLAANSLS